MRSFSPTPSLLEMDEIKVMNKGCQKLGFFQLRERELGWFLPFRESIK